MAETLRPPVEEGAPYEHPAVAACWEALGVVMDEAGEEGCDGTESVTVSSGDLIAVLSLVAAVPLEARDLSGDIPCERCGHAMGITAYVPNEVWEEIYPPVGGIPVGVLCVWCMDALAAEKGIPGPVPLTFHHRGRVLMAGNPLDRALAAQQETPDA